MRFGKIGLGSLWAGNSVSLFAVHADNYALWLCTSINFMAFPLAFFASNAECLNEVFAENAFVPHLGMIGEA